MDRAFFSNYGHRGLGGALKLARAHAGLLRSEGKKIGTKFLALEHSFHGRTYGSMATTHKEKYREPFAPGVPGVEFVRFNDVADLREKFSDEVCAILLEAIQGEGGIRALSQSSSQRHGSWRTRPERCCLRTRFSPAWDAQVSGLRISTTAFSRILRRWRSRLREESLWARCSARKRRHARFTPGMHGTTFGGGPLACAVAIAVIDEMRAKASWPT